MSAVIRRAARPLATRWFWALALLALPNCTLDRSGIATPYNLQPGSQPRTGAVFCDIERVASRRCATATDLEMGIRFSEAATALNEGRSSAIGLDDSADALARCGGQPEAVTYQGPFPQGLPVCLNCSEVIPSRYSTPLTACRTQCYDFFGETTSSGFLIPTVPPTDATRTFCDATTRISTNADPDACAEGVCSNIGSPLADYLDPRRLPEPVIWADFIGTATGSASNDLARTAATTGSFDAGAVSRQWISRGDGYVEFSARQADQLQMLGLSPIPPGCSAPCADTDPDFRSIGFALDLSFDGRVYLFESGLQVVGPDLNDSFGTYAAGERFRVSFDDNGDGTATVRYGRVIGACSPGSPCNVDVIHTSSGRVRYPFRVDTSIREQSAVLTDVRIVRIR